MTKTPTITSHAAAALQLLHAAATAATTADEAWRRAWELGTTTRVIEALQRRGFARQRLRNSDLEYAITAKGTRFLDERCRCGTKGHDDPSKFPLCPAHPGQPT